MIVEVWYSIRAANEAGRMSRRWYYWPVFALQHFFGIATVGALMYFGGVGLVRQFSSPKPDFPRVGLGLLLLAGPGLAFWWLYRRDVSKANREFAAINPQRVEFTQEGLRVFEKGGGEIFAPWSNFNGFREGKHVILLRRVEGALQMIPKRTVPVEAVGQIQSAVRSRLPEIR